MWGVGWCPERGAPVARAVRRTAPAPSVARRSSPDGGKWSGGENRSDGGRRHVGGERRTAPCSLTPRRPRARPSASGAFPCGGPSSAPETGHHRELAIAAGPSAVRGPPRADCRPYAACRSGCRAARCRASTRRLLTPTAMCAWREALSRPHPPARRAPRRVASRMRRSPSVLRRYRVRTSGLFHSSRTARSASSWGWSCSRRFGAPGRPLFDFPGLCTGQASRH